MLDDDAHREIRLVGDRSWTMRLLDALLRQDGAEDELDRVVATLRALDDERVVRPLRAVLFDRHLASRLRDQASSVLIACDDAVTDAELREWWRSGDALIREHAIYSMGHAQSDIVLAVAGDHQHPLQAAALTAMASGFDDARAVDVAVHALEHRDPRVRLAAARQLLWEEPVAAESALLHAAEDPDAEVAVEAIYALSYYTSRRVVRSLSRLAARVDGQIAERVKEALSDLVDVFESSLQRGSNEQAIERLWGWMAPVADLVRRPAIVDPHEPATSKPGSPVTRMSEEAVLALLSEPDAPWYATVQTLGTTDWKAFDRAERGRLRAVLTQHPTRAVRSIAPFALAAWNDHDALVVLANDPSLGVRRHAMEVIREMPPNEVYAALAWNVVTDASGSHRRTAIEAYARHAVRPDAISGLHRLAKDDPSSSARLQAITSLAALGARDALTDLLPLLDEPPITNWAVHTELLDAITRLGLPRPSTDNLVQIDDLYVAEALCNLEVASESTVLSGDEGS